MSSEQAVAHVRQDADGTWHRHDLEEHLREVSLRAGVLAAGLKSASWAELAGVWHDLGKYQPAFQKYIGSASGMDAHIEALGKVKHAIAGAIHAVDHFRNKGNPGYGRLLAYLIAGHHAGLPDWDSAETGGAALSPQLAADSDRQTLANAVLGGAPAGILDPATELPRPPVSRADQLHLWLRMLFSCLVDADFLDTERFMDESRSTLREGYDAIDDPLVAAFDRHMNSRFSVADTPVKQLRTEILANCLAAAPLAPGLFSLTVPTGGGKTLASLGFALRHAKTHGLKRVIYVIPYTSIIEQTAGVFRDVFADVEPEPVIEHHSNFDVEKETAKSRIACENWDAPVVVTTSVQFFESLYAAKPSRCRKLHNVAESVVILDEVQLLPPEHLAPILDALRQLMANYRVSIVLSTATQPQLQQSRVDAFGRTQLQGLGEARELAPDPARLYRELERVRVQLPKDDQLRRNWDDLAGELAEHPQVLCIVNRRDDAAELWQRMPVGTLHLSARMCGAHRAEVIGAIRKALAAKQPVRVISTQLVEAGVDLDFPVVYRAMAGLDSIAQAAGRCNREGKLPEKGRVIVFNPPKPSPSGLLLKAEQAATNILHSSSGEPLTQENFVKFFDHFYGAVNTHDQSDILSLLNRDAAKGQIQFRSAAARFRLIEDQGQRPVFVLFGHGAKLIETLRKIGPKRDLMRKLQRHSVTLYEHQWKKLLASGDLEPDGDFLYQRTTTLYHPMLGLLPEAPDYDPASLYQ